MSSFDPIDGDDFDENNPFGAMGFPGGFQGFPPIFADASSLFSSTGPLNWDIARQTAEWSATDGQSEPNVDPADRNRIEEFLRIAELHVADATGRGVPAGLRANVVTKREWARIALDAYKPHLEALATAMGKGDLLGGIDGDADPQLNIGELIANMGQFINPALLGIQCGMMVGHLAGRSFGQYDYPVPRSGQELLFVSSNISDFAKDWSLPVEDLQFWVCIHQLVHHVVLNIPHVAARINELINEYVSNFAPNSDALEEHIRTIDPTDPNSIQIVLDDPNAILGALQTPAQQGAFKKLEAIISVLEGYVDWVVDKTGSKLISSFSQLEEALLRRRVEETEADRFVERLLGFSLGQAQYDRGTAFVEGVIERAGEGALARIWESAESLPTPPEADAPGLWLARIEL